MNNKVSYELLGDYLFKKDEWYVNHIKASLDKFFANRTEEEVDEYNIFPNGSFNDMDVTTLQIADVGDKWKDDSLEFAVVKRENGLFYLTFIQRIKG